MRRGSLMVKNQGSAIIPLLSLTHACGAGVSFRRRQGARALFWGRGVSFGTFVERGCVMKNQGSAIIPLLRSRMQAGLVSAFEDKGTLGLFWGRRLSFRNFHGLRLCGSSSSSSSSSSSPSPSTQAQCQPSKTEGRNVALWDE